MDVRKHLKTLPLATIKDIIRKHDELYYIKLGQKKPQLIDALVNHYNQTTATHLVPKQGKNLRYKKSDEPPKEKIKVNITKKQPVAKPVEKLIEKIKLNITKKKPLIKLVEKLVDKIEEKPVEKQVEKIVDKIKVNIANEKPLVKLVQKLVDKIESDSDSDDEYEDSPFDSKGNIKVNPQTGKKYTKRDIEMYQQQKFDELAGEE